jgi:PAS domain S-box-containing protein
LLFRALPTGLLAGQVNAGILSFVLWDVVDHPVLVAWFATITLLTMLRYALILAYRRAPAAHTGAPRWTWWFSVGTALSGAVWGSVAMVLFPADIAHQIFVIFVLTGMTAGAVVSFSALWQIGLMFNILTLAPLVVRLFLDGREMHLAMGVMASLYLALMGLITRRMYQTILGSLQLRFENSGLVRVLAREKAATEGLNLELKREIEERERGEQGLRESEARMRTLIDNVPDGIVTINDQGCIESLNPAAERMFGYPAADIIGAKFNTLLPEADREEYDRFISDHRGFGREKTVGFGLEISGLRKDGHVFPMEIGMSGMWLERRHYFIAIVRDISERREMERMKSQFLATVNHELRTPLTSVLGSLGLLAEGIAGELSERGQALLGITRNNVERLVRLIGNILDMDDIQSGRLRLESRPISLNRLVETVVEENRGFAASVGVRLELAPGPADALVYADGQRLSQAINHLLSNALKYSPRGGTVGVRMTRVPGYLRLAVTDQGPGIPKDFHARMFQAFSQAETGDAAVRSGAGLGLSIARALVEQHAGRIGFEPIAAGGTCFYFELPELHNGALESH